MVIRFLLIMSIVFGFLNASSKNPTLKECRRLTYLHYEKEVKNAWVVVSKGKQHYTVSNYIISDNSIVFISNKECIIFYGNFIIHQKKTIWD